MSSMTRTKILVRMRSWDFFLLLLQSFFFFATAAAASAGGVAQQQRQRRQTVFNAAPDSTTTNLPWSETGVNVLIVTDVHSWVGGHKHENADAADYGDVLSLWEHLQEYAWTHNHDLYFVMNGDWIDGTGLAMNGDVSKLIPILEKMDFDVITIGNHELYFDSVLNEITKTSGFIEFMGHKYISSNTYIQKPWEPQTPITGYQYRILHGQHSDVLVFGFLYDMQDHADLVNVQDVESTVQEDWFKSAIQNEDYQSILVLAHMDVRDELCTVILSRIRHFHNTMPVQFITGHTHKRDYQKFDEYSVSLEAGRYLDTIGFVSFPTTTILQADNKKAKNKNLATALTATSSNASTATAPQEEDEDPELFQHRLLDANVVTLAETVGLTVETFPTENGIAQSEFIQQVQMEMGLDEMIGCITQSYYLENRSLYDPDSVWAFFAHDVVPSRFPQDHVVFLPKGSWRYDLLEGEVRMFDAIAVAPFNTSLYMYENIPAEIIMQLNATMNTAVLDAEPCSWMPLLPSYILAPARPPFQATGRNYTLVVDLFDLGRIKDALAEISSSASLPEPVDMPGFTTTSPWIDYFLDNAHTCKNGQKSHGSNHGVGHGSNNNKSSGVGFAGSNPEADSARLIFVCVALVIIALLGTIAVYQKGTHFRHMVDAQEFATLEAIREYTDDDDAGDDDDGNDDDEEGYFV